MKVGDLVRIPKARIGVPADSLGLVVSCGASKPRNWFIYNIQLARPDGLVIRRLARDLEVVK